LLPFFTSLPNFAGRVAGAGASGVTLFGRYTQCGSSLRSVDSRILWELTEPGDVTLPLQWLSIIRKCCPKLSFAASGGATTGEQAIRLMQSGADVVMLTSPVYRRGAAAIQQILDEMHMWAGDNQCESLREIVAESCHRRENFPQAYQRAAATHQITSVAEEE
jgi:dihydroorotate dehydrogenase (fumarate)